MGYKFLKHVERTRLLVLIVDLFGFQLSASHQHRTCLENIFALNKELELYNTELLKKPAILLLNKIDVEGSEKQFDLIRKTAEDLSGRAILTGISNNYDRLIKLFLFALQLMLVNADLN